MNWYYAQITAQESAHQNKLRLLLEAHLIYYATKLKKHSHTMETSSCCAFTSTVNIAFIIKDHCRVPVVCIAICPISVPLV